jgi:hypothetical protein
VSGKAIKGQAPTLMHPAHLASSDPESTEHATLMLIAALIGAKDGR